MRTPLKHTVRKDTAVERPFFSIITVCYQAGEKLIETVRNVLAQSFSSFELIVKDGGSTDGSLEELKEINDTRLKLVSCKDRGIYDAMNSAISLSRGKFLYFLNCGDRLLNNGTLFEVYNSLSALECTSDEAPDIIAYGSCQTVNGLLTQPKRITELYLYRRPINHQSMFFGVGVFRNIGAYDISLRIRADHELTLRAFRHGTKFIRISETVCVYEGGGFSESEASRQARSNELTVIRHRYFTSAQRRSYDLLLKLSLKRLRNRMASSNSPKPLRRLYNTISNIFNR